MGMTLPEYQGLGCLIGGVVGAAGVYGYSDVVAVAITGVVTNPVLLVPVMVTGLAVGCAVGSTLSPAFLLLSKL
jgi:precorrin-3B methylase